MTRTQTALIALLQELHIPRDAVIVPGRGEPYKDESGYTHIRYTVPGRPDEYHLKYQLKHVKPFGREQ